MSKGYLILVQNSGDTNYLKMAYGLALSIKNTQSEVNSVAIATNDEVPKKYKKVFDHIVEIPWDDQAQDSKWKIENKWKYYYMTPFDETVVLDADMYFPEDISYWWDILKEKEIWITNKPQTFRGEIITSTKYRPCFKPNQLPNVYTAFMYFRKTEMTAEIFKMTELIFHNYEKFFFDFLDETRPRFLSGDVAYALAIKILGYENECFSQVTSVPSFVHMKAHLQNVDESLITDDWTQHFPTYLSNDGKLKIGNYAQHLPFHYQNKNWLTDEYLQILENRVYE
jgi:hypothetical protein